MTTSQKNKRLSKLLENFEKFSKDCLTCWQAETKEGREFIKLLYGKEKSY